MRFENSDLRSKRATGTVYIWKYMVPLLLVCVVGILVMSQNTGMRILGLTETKYSSPRMSNES